jgi:hypothetical protein
MIFVLGWRFILLLVLGVDDADCAANTEVEIERLNRSTLRVVSSVNLSLCFANFM